MIKFIKMLILLTIVAISIAIFFYLSKNSFRKSLEFSQKNITLIDNGNYFYTSTELNIISDFLKEQNITLANNDKIFPDINSKIFPGEIIQINRAIPISIQADGKKINGFTFSKSVREAVLENGIALNRLDKTVPDLDSLPLPNSTIVVTRINVEEIIQDEDIPFKTTIKTDSTLGWREKNITTPGVVGTNEVKYRITYKDGKEVSRVVLSKTKIKDPITQVETDGTYVKVGKADKGQATWYSYQGGMFAASLTIPRGGYARVTNTATGKSIIVQINDAGPYGKGRIIDLDKVAFQKIAPLGAGVINVKVEEVLN